MKKIIITTLLLSLAFFANAREVECEHDGSIVTIKIVGENVEIYDAGQPRNIVQINEYKSAEIGERYGWKVAMSEGILDVSATYQYPGHGEVPVRYKLIDLMRSYGNYATLLSIYNNGNDNPIWSFVECINL